MADADLSEDVGGQLPWPRFEQVQIIEDGMALAILLREFDGTISAVRIPIDRLAD